MAIFMSFICWVMGTPRPGRGANARPLIQQSPCPEEVPRFPVE
jgi:hypothetical protein